MVLIPSWILAGCPFFDEKAPKRPHFVEDGDILDNGGDRRRGGDCNVVCMHPIYLKSRIEKDFCERLKLWALEVI